MKVYCKNAEVCRRQQLMDHFDSMEIIKTTINNTTVVMYVLLYANVLTALLNLTHNECHVSKNVVLLQSLMVQKSKLHPR